MNRLKATLTLVLAGCVVVFAIQNMATVELQFLFWSFSAPRVFIFGLILLTGFLMGFLISGLSRRRGTQRE